MMLGAMLAAVTPHCTPISVIHGVPVYHDDTLVFWESAPRTPPGQSEKAIRHATLGRDYFHRGMHYAKQTRIDFFQSKRLSSGILTEASAQSMPHVMSLNHDIRWVGPVVPGSRVHFYPNGAVRRVQLAQSVSLPQGAVVAPDTTTEWHDNGNAKTATLASTYTERGVVFDAGDILYWEPEGALSAAYVYGVRPVMGVPCRGYIVFETGTHVQAVLADDHPPFARGSRVSIKNGVVTTRLPGHRELPLYRPAEAPKSTILSP